MTAKEFLQQAREKIADKPYDRLSDSTLKAVKDDDCIFDVHCHIFDKKSVPVNYLVLRMLNSSVKDMAGARNIGGETVNPNRERRDMFDMEVEEFYDLLEKRETEKEVDWEKFEELTEEFIKEKDLSSERGLRTMWNGAKRTLKILKKGDMFDVFQHYHDKISVHNLPEFHKLPFVTAALMMDMQTAWPKGKVRKDYSMQVEELRQIASTEPVLPFLAIDPRRENLYEMFLKAFEKGRPSFFGVKCYPALGYFPADLRLDPIFEICAEKNIPVTTHCGGESVSTTDSRILRCVESMEKEDFYIPGVERADRARYLNDPLNWKPVVIKYPKLRLNLAHFGSDYFWKNYQQNGKDERIESIIDLISDDNFNVFTDFSFNIVESDFTGELLKLLTNNEKIRNKVMFGTDYWVVLPYADLLNKQKEFLEKFKTFQKELLSANTRRFLFGDRIATVPDK